MEKKMKTTHPRGAAASRLIGTGLAAWLLLSMPAAPASADMDPAAHAPIGVMGDHTHAQGELMFSYRYMRMRMNGLRDGDERISSSAVLQDFMVTPLSMDMEMHMFGVMYAPLERITLMAMLPWVQMDMRHKTRTGGRFTTYADGIGDFRLSALVDLWQSGEGHDFHRVHGQLGLSFPTGSITEADRTPISAGARVRLPYPMQIGSGTWDLLPALTYRGREGRIGWGGQARGEIRLNENHADYRVGNEYGLTAWGSYTLNEWVSFSLRAEWSHQMNVRGRDPSITTSMMGTPLVPTADPGRRAAMRLDALAGVNFMLPVTALKGLRLAVEAGLPAYQYLDGPALETDWITTVGVQYAFH
jgi:hypothetical protein